MATRPIWKGSISFGLVNVPIALYTAEKKMDLNFKLLDSRNKARVHYERVNEITGEEVPWNEIVRAYEYADGSYVLVKEEELKKVAVEASKTVEIEDFVDQDVISYVYFDKPYYLVPDKRGEKGYVLLRETLKRTGKVGIARVVIRSRQYLAVLYPEGRALVLNLIRYRQELSSAEEFSIPGEDLKEYKISEKEIDLAEKLVENMAGGWEPEKYHDEYREALMNWIEKKAEKGEMVTVPEAEEAAEKEEAPKAEVINIMDQLRKSVEESERKHRKKTGEKKKHHA